MRKNGPKEQSQRLRASASRWVLALVVACLLAAPIAVQAELKATNLAYSWDITSDEFEWGHVTVDWDGSWIPLLQEVRFDEIPWSSDDPNDPPPCTDPDETTVYVGWIEYGLPFLDNDPEGARGFQETRRWTLIDCDLNQNGTWDDDDLLEESFVDTGIPPELWLADCCTDEGECDNKNCRILPNPDLLSNVEHPWLWDLEQACTGELSEHCDQEIATKLWINLDLDCDQSVDDAFRDPDTGQPEPICVYSEARTPDYEAGEEIWAFPLGVRISDNNGAKTLMLYPDPTAVELASFGAELQGHNVLLSWETATEMDNLGFNVYRAIAASGERVRLNERLIPSQSLGSTVGSSYQFVDRSAEPDTAYHYWLEDIDLGGAGTMNGPAVVHTPRARQLPCRSRPAPMPGLME